MKPRNLAGAGVGLGLALSLLLFVSGMCKAPHKRADLWFEVGKAGVSLFAVSIVGGAFALGAKYWESLREERRRLNDFRVGLLRATIGAYHDIKSVRRRLRASGLFTLAEGEITAHQAAEFHGQMNALNNAHLELERVRRELEAHPQAFRQEPKPDAAVRKVEKYVRGILRDWERNGSRIVDGASFKVLEDMTNVRAFLVDSREAFAVGAARPMEEVEEAIRSQLLPSWRAAPPP
jgi:hypothetical protein